MDIEKNLSAAILVGLSTRMGRDKALLLLDGQTFIGRLAQELSGYREVFISTALDRDYSACGLKVLVDENRNVGPMEGIRHSLSYAGTDCVFICAVDMPFVRREMMLYLAETISPEDDACVYRDGDRVHPLCGIYRKTALPVAEGMIAEGRYRMMELLARLRTKYVDVEAAGFPRETLRNINTPEDYAGISL